MSQFQNAPFARPLRQIKILILKILNVFLRLKCLSSLISNEIEHFETGSNASIFFVRPNEAKVKVTADPGRMNQASLKIQLHYRYRPRPYNILQYKKSLLLNL